MLVYRIQSPENYGPYTSSTIWGQLSCAVNMSNVRNSRPAPDQDGISFCSSELFGFQSIELLCNWFGSVFKRLSEEGYVLAIYDIAEEHIKFGKKQCCFREPDEKLTDFYDLSVMDEIMSDMVRR